MKEILKHGIDLLSEQTAIRRRIRDISKDICPDLQWIHCLSLGLIHSIYTQYIGIPGKTNESISARLPLLASFVQGIDLVETTIVEGLYSQAAVLLKQELETIAAVNECIKGIRENKRTPNVKYVDYDLKKLYPILNGIGHVSEKDPFEELYIGVPDHRVVDQKPVSITPLFNKQRYEQFYGIHILLIVQAIEKLVELYNDMYEFSLNEKQEEALMIIYKVLLEQDFLRLDE